MNNGRCICDTDGIISCWVESLDCYHGGNFYKHNTTFEDRSFASIHGLRICTCTNRNTECRKSPDCYYDGVYSEHMSTYDYTSLKFKDQKFVCICKHSVVECKEFGYCYIKGDWIKNGESIGDYIGFDIKSRKKRIDTCTCIHGKINCIWEPGSCFRNRSRIKHGKTFEDDRGIDKISGFHRTDTCICEHEKITCKWENAPCKHGGHFFKHLEKRQGNSFKAGKCICKHGKWDCYVDIGLLRGY
ncbi:hypothetical protein BsWGS_08711 [Bradybaena similaris]